MVDNLSSGTIGYVAMRSNGRPIRLLGEDAAIVHGSEEAGIAPGGKRSLIPYVYTDIVMRRNGKWQIAASPLARAGGSSSREVMETLAYFANASLFTT